MLTLNELFHQINGRTVGQARGFLVARSHVGRTDVGRHVGHGVASLAARVPCGQIQPLAVSGQSGRWVTGQRLDVFAGGHRTCGQRAEQASVTGRGVGEQMKGERWQFRNTKGPRHDVTLAVGAKVKRCVEMVGPGFGHPAALGHLAHQGKRSTAGDGVDAETVARIVTVHHVQARTDAQVGAEHRQRLVFGAVHAVHVDGTTAHLHAVHGGAVGRFARDGTGRTTAGLLGVGQRFMPVFAREFVGGHGRHHRNRLCSFGHGFGRLAARTAAHLER